MFYRVSVDLSLLFFSRWDRCYGFLGVQTTRVTWVFLSHHVKDLCLLMLTLLTSFISILGVSTVVAFYLFNWVWQFGGPAAFFLICNNKGKRVVRVNSRSRMYLVYSQKKIGVQSKENSSCRVRGQKSKLRYRHAELGAAPVVQWLSLPATQEAQKTRVWFLGQEDPLEKERATHSSILG